MRYRRHRRRLAVWTGALLGVAIVVGPPACAPTSRTVDERALVAPGRSAGRSGLGVPEVRRRIATRSALLADHDPAGSAAPTRISVPAVDIDAEVAPVGVSAAGELAVPGERDVAGWYRAGSSPGSPVGSAVVAGHVDFDGRLGVFARLAEVGVGDRIDVADASGMQRSFVIVSVDRYAKAHLPTVELFRRTGPPTLTLITCGGEFRRASRSYADNVVVRAVPAGGEVAGGA